MNYSNNPYNGYQNEYQGAEIQLKTSPHYVGPSQLGYGSQPVYTHHHSTFERVTEKFTGIFSPKKQEESQLIYENVSIISKKAQKVLDVCQDKDRQGMLIIYEDYKQPNQRFDIVKVGDYVNIINRKNGKALTVSGNTEKNGAPIFEQPMSNLMGQRFRLALVEKNDFLIHTFCGKVLDCCQERTANGTSVIQWKCDRKEHQYWQIK